MKCTASAKQPAAAALEIEQPAFGVEPPAESGERSVASDHPMTRDDDRDGIRTIGCTHRPQRLRVIDALGDVEIGARGAIWNRRQRMPYGALKIGSIRRQRNVEGASFAVEVFL